MLNCISSDGLVSISAAEFFTRAVSGSSKLLSKSLRISSTIRRDAVLRNEGTEDLTLLILALSHQKTERRPTSSSRGEIRSPHTTFVIL